MPIEIADVVNDFAAALKRVDDSQPVGPAARFKPGVGPLTEDEVTNAIVDDLKKTFPKKYDPCGPRGYPSSRYSCDVVIPARWAIEIKLARPFGDNGKPAERWSENLLYPYPGNTSSIGDCLKLLSSGFGERKAVVVIGYEHTPPKIALEPAIASFELIAQQIMGIQLSPRAQRTIVGLVHPFHQQAHVYGWEVLGLNAPSA